MCDKVKEEEKGGAYGTYGSWEMQTGFWWGNLKERDLLQNVEIDDRAMIKRSYAMGWEGMDWIHVLQDMEKRQLLWMR